MENRHPMSASLLRGGGYNVLSDGEAPRGGGTPWNFWWGCVAGSPNSDLASKIQTHF